MKQLLFGIAVLFAFASCSGTAEVNIVPQPNSMEVKSGSFNVAGASFTVEGLDRKTEKMVAGFAQSLSAVTGKQSRIAEKGTFHFMSNPDLDAEEYLLKVTSHEVTVEAADYNGFLYAVSSFVQMLPVEYFSGKKTEGVKWTVPCVIIQDKPRFGYRGFMLDCCRHFFSVEEVKKMLDVMALHKLNRLHWHLTEDQGWRIEIKAYPKLTEIGAYREGTMVGHYPSDPKDIVVDDVRYGGFYTQDQLREVVAYASERGITIIPEIDLPGHMVAALASYPELGCTGGPYEVRKIWGIAEEALCPGKESTFDFLEAVLAEVMDIFPSEYIHVGGDECLKGEWAKCRDCQKRIKKLGLKADKNHSAEQYLQNYVTARVQKFLNEHGRKLIGWDEILEGNLAEGATVMSWRGVSGGIKAASKGFDAVMSPTTYAYFDYYQAEDTSLEPLAIGGFLPIDSVYAYVPLKGIPEEAQKHILGVQANLWTEYVARPEHLEYMALPRMDALSEVQWCQEQVKDFDRFKKSLQHMFRIYDQAGYTYCKEIIGQHGLPGIEGGKN